MTKEKKNKAKEEIAEAIDAVNTVVADMTEKAEGITEWQKKVEADLNAMALRCYEPRYLQINSHKPEFVDLKKENK